MTPILSTRDESLIEKTSQLAQRLALPFIQLHDLDPNQERILLVLSADGLWVELPGQGPSKPFRIDFTTKEFIHRLKKSTLSGELIAKAMGCKPKQNYEIIDATAGLGRDSMILTKLGFRVKMLERSPILHALLECALMRAQNYFPWCNPTTLQLIHADSRQYLQKLIDDNLKPEVIYLDPMFPTRAKSAAVKKEMIVLQNLVGKDIDAGELLELAQLCAQKRVVVKRPKSAANISEKAPNFRLNSKSHRFDIYLT